MADSEEQNTDRDSSGQPPLIRFDSPWAWFYYITFGIQVMIATYHAAESEINASVPNTLLETYTLITKAVSSQIPAMAAYSLIIAATVEGIRMIAERYLARRFAEGKKQGQQEGMEQGRAEGKEQGRAEGKEQGRAESFEELTRWLDANPVIKKAIESAVESGEANPPPFINHSSRDQS